MIPGEVIAREGEIELNAGRRTLRIDVTNRGDRPIQVGSHYHFAETNAALDFDRRAARGMRLNIPAGTAVRFEPGQSRSVELVDYAGARKVFGFRGAVMGALEPGRAAAPAAKAAASRPPASRRGPAKKAAAAKAAKARKGAQR